MTGALSALAGVRGQSPREIFGILKICNLEITLQKYNLRVEHYHPSQSKCHHPRLVFVSAGVVVFVWAGVGEPFARWSFSTEFQIQSGFKVVYLVIIHHTRLDLQGRVARRALIDDVPYAIPNDNHFPSDLKSNVIHFWHLGTLFGLLFGPNPLDGSILSARKVI